MQAPAWKKGPVVTVQGACGHTWQADVRGRTGPDLLAFIANYLKTARCGNCLWRAHRRRKRAMLKRLKQVQRQVMKLHRARARRGGARRG